MHSIITLAFWVTKAHCWFMVNLLTIRTPRISFSELLSSRSTLTWTNACRYSSPRCMTLHLLLLNQIRFFSIPLSSLSRSCWMSATALWHVRHSSWLCIISRLTESAFYPFIHVTDKNVKQDQTQYQSLGKTLLVGLQLESMKPIKTLWALPVHHFSVYLTVHSSNLLFLRLSTRILWVTVSKTFLKSR